MLPANDQSKMERAFTGAAKCCCEGGSVNKHTLTPQPGGGNLQQAGKTFLGCLLSCSLACWGQGLAWRSFECANPQGGRAAQPCQQGFALQVCVSGCSLLIHLPGEEWDCTLQWLCGASRDSRTFPAFSSSCPFRFVTTLLSKQQLLSAFLHLKLI